MERNSGPKVKVGLRINPELHRAVKARAAQLGMNLERAYELALERWSNQNSESSGDPASGLRIPDHMLPTVEWFMDWFATPGSPEVEMLKTSIREWSAQRSADLRKNAGQHKQAAL